MTPKTPAGGHDSGRGPHSAPGREVSPAPPAGPMNAAVPEPTLEGQIAEVAETLTRDRMAYYGYTPEQVEAVENWPGHDASGCFFENTNWVCTDEDDKPNHPDRDELEQTAEFVMWVLEHPAVVEVRERAVEEAPMTPWGPYEMGGFEGCTDRDPEHCACATDVQPTCRICDQEIEPGEMAWSRQWPCYDTLPLDHRDQDWDVISWHDDCPELPRIVRAGGRP